MQSLLLFVAVVAVTEVRVVAVSDANDEAFLVWSKLHPHPQHHPLLLTMLMVVAVAVFCAVRVAQLHASREVEQDWVDLGRVVRCVDSVEVCFGVCCVVVPLAVNMLQSGLSLLPTIHVY